MLYEDNARLVQRIGFYKIGFFALIFFLAANFWYLQIIRGNAYRILALENSIKLIEWDAPRGIIEDRNGIVLVDNRPAYDIAIVLEEVDRLEHIIEFLCRNTGADMSGIYDRIERCKHYPPFKPIVILEDVDIADVAFIESRRKDLKGIRVEISSRRSYLYSSLASHVLGYVGEITDTQLASGGYSDAQPGDIIGKAGLELKYNNLLTGIKGWRKVEVTGYGRIKRNLETKIFTQGYRLRLTLDKYLQEAAEKALKDFSGSIVAIDPRNGSVLAMVSHPVFDPNLFSSRISEEDWLQLKNDPGHPLQNRAVQSTYPPGSTFKTVMALAALNEGVITPETGFYCSGATKIYNHVFRCWRGGGHGYVSLKEAIEDSCNVYFYNVGKLLGREKIAEYAEKIGFGSLTGIDLYNEVRGIIPDDRFIQKTKNGRWYPGETISIAIGQGVLNATPIQLAVFAAALQNGGILYRPHFMDAYFTPEGEETPFEPEERGRIPIATRHFETLKEAMLGVVLRGTGKRAGVEGLRICGKTGTAQVVRKRRRIPGEEIPVKERNHSVFISFCLDQPLAVVVVAEHGEEGGKTAAPIAREIYKVYYERSVKKDV